MPVSGECHWVVVPVTDLAVVLWLVSLMVCGFGYPVWSSFRSARRSVAAAEAMVSGER